MAKSKHIIAFIVIIYLNILIVPGFAQEMKEKTGDVALVTWNAGQYTESDGKITNSPVQIVPFTAPETGWGYFYVESSEADAPDPWLPSWRRQGETSFSSGNFQVQKGDVLEIEAWPYVYSSQMGVVGDELVFVNKYHAQTNVFKYYMGYTETVETVLLASCTHTPTSPYPGQQVQITSTSTVQNGEIYSIKWYLNGAHQSSYDNLNAWAWIPQSTGNYEIKIEVMDSTGQTDVFFDHITVREESSYKILDQAFTTGVQNNEPIDRKSTFSYGDDIYFWMKLGNVKGEHHIYLEWETPRVNEIVTNTYIEVPSPSTQGKTEWIDYVIVASIQQGSDVYDLVFRDPGYWKAKGLIDQDMFEYSFKIEGSLKHEAQMEKTKYITRETIEVSGSLTFNGAPLPGARISPILVREGELYEALPEIPVAGDGGYTLGHVIPVLHLDAQPTEPEDWLLRLTPILDSEYGQESMEIKFQVLPVWVTIERGRLVQIIEPPEIDDGFFKVPHIAADREAGARINLKIHGYESGFTVPQINIQFNEEDRTTGNVLTSTASPVFKDGEGHVDFLFTKQPGLYMFSAEVDREMFYTPHTLRAANTEAVTWSQICRSKEMEKMYLRFVPVDMGWMQSYSPDYYTEEDDRKAIAYFNFVKKHTDFIEDVYPLPLDYFTFDVTMANRKPPQDIEDVAPQTNYQYNSKRYDTVIWLGKEAFLSKVKIVAVTPKTKMWWASPKTMTEQGYASFITYAPPIYNTKAVIVIDGASKGVSAHEVAHTLGLYRYMEHYSTKKEWELGKSVTSLVMKDGVIYDMDDPEEVIAFGGPGAYQPICFMGRNPGWPKDAWVSDVTMEPLFKALMDPPHERTLLVNGVYEDGELTLDTWYEGFGLPDLTEQGIYSIRCLDDNGGILTDATFGGDNEEIGFSFAVAFPEETSSVEFLRNDVLLETVMVSENEPVVSIGSVDISLDLTLDWSGNDADGDALSYSVLYSNNNQETWELMSLEQTGTTGAFNMEVLPGGSNCYVKVIASDGLRTGEAVYGPFSVEEKAPMVAITVPNVNTTISSRMTIEGVGIDFEDGLLSDTQLSWYSDLDGYLGAGSQLACNLSIGTHTLRLVATGLDGVKAEDSLEVTIEERSISLVQMQMYGGVNQDGTPYDQRYTFESSEIAYSFVEVANASIGDLVEWIYYGPDGNTLEAEREIELVGGVLISSGIDLSQMDENLTAGQWTVEVYLNQYYAGENEFTVSRVNEPPTGFYPLGGIIGLVIIVALAGGGYVVVKRLRRPKNPAQQAPATAAAVPRAEPAQKQRFCDNCGKPATWIEKYQRWYCYDCEKYLD